MPGLLGKPHSQFAIAHHFGTNGGPQLVQGQNSRSFAKSHMRAPPIINPIGGVLAGGFHPLPFTSFNTPTALYTADLTGEYKRSAWRPVPTDIRTNCTKQFTNIT